MLFSNKLECDDDDHVFAMDNAACSNAGHAEFSAAYTIKSMNWTTDGLATVTNQTILGDTGSLSP